MTLSQIQYFLTAARCLNFTTAARELYISQPALGRQISAMEEELCAELFIRGKNSLKLTPIGTMLQGEFTTLMVQYNNILQKVYAMGSDDSVVVRIGILQGYGLGDIFPRFLSAGRTDFPGLMIDLSTGSYSELNARLLEGSLDIALTFEYDVRDRPDILVHPLCTVPLYFACHNSVVDTDRNRDGLEDHLLILNNPEDSPAAFARDKSLYEQMNMVWRYKLAENINEQLFFVRQGYGCAILAGNCTARADSSIRFEKRPGLPDTQLAAVWNIHAVNPGIPACLKLLDQLIAQSQDIISQW